MDINSQIAATQPGSRVTSVDFVDNLLVTGSSCGVVKLFNLATGQELAVISEGMGMVNQVERIIIYFSW